MSLPIILKYSYIIGKDDGNIVKKAVSICYKILLFFAILLPSLLHAQTDYTGTYYIGSNGYNAGTPANNYYLCPTEGWCFYEATGDMISILFFMILL